MARKQTNNISHFLKNKQTEDKGSISTKEEFMQSRPSSLVEVVQTGEEEEKVIFNSSDMAVAAAASGNKPENPSKIANNDTPNEEQLADMLLLLSRKNNELPYQTIINIWKKMLSRYDYTDLATTGFYLYHPYFWYTGMTKAWSGYLSKAGR